MLNNLQALRAIAALMVVLVHVGAIAHLGLGRSLDFGHAGVDLFFVISGYVMVHTIARRPIGPGGFLLNRIVRVVPLYWAFTIALYLLSLAGALVMQPERSTPWQFVQSLLFIPYGEPGSHIQPLYFLGWTLNMEMAFYLLFALCIAANRGRLERVVLSCAGIIIAVACASALFPPSSVALQFYTRPIILEFALGMMLALAFAKGLQIRAVTAGALIIAGGVFLLLYPSLGIPTHSVWVLPASGAVVAGALALEQHGHAIRSGFLLLIGAASYSLYLSHPFATAAADRLSLKVSPAVAPTIAILFALPVAILIALAVHYLFERPVNDRLRRIMAHGRSVVSRQEDAILGEAAARSGEGEGGVTPSDRIRA